MTAQELTTLVERLNRKRHECESCGLNGPQSMRFGVGKQADLFQAPMTSRSDGRLAKIHNLMTELARKGKIGNRGSRGAPAWHTLDKLGV
jgi:hypothetical protein